MLQDVWATQRPFSVWQAAILPTHDGNTNNVGERFSLLGLRGIHQAFSNLKVISLSNIETDGFNRRNSSNAILIPICTSSS
jgi:hypothetical protein